MNEFKFICRECGQLSDDGEPWNELCMECADKRTAQPLENFNDIDWSLFSLPIVAVFYDPDDYPCKYVARIFDGKIPSKCFIIRNSLEEMINEVPYYMARFARYEDDDPKIIETWI